ncbi:MAG: hypothetical protein WKH64_16830 [Chloroflexia bacterium]
MTGFEYTAAVGMLYEGKTDAGLRCIEAVRRATTAQTQPLQRGGVRPPTVVRWRAGRRCSRLPAEYNGVEGALRFAAAAEPSTAFWSNGYAWGCSSSARPATGSRPSCPSSTAGYSSGGSRSGAGTVELDAAPRPPPTIRCASPCGALNEPLSAALCLGPTPPNHREASGGRLPRQGRASGARSAGLCWGPPVGC